MKILVISRCTLGYITHTLKLCRYASQENEVTHMGSDRLRYMLENQSKTLMSKHYDVITVPSFGGRLRRNFRWLWHCTVETGKDYDVIYMYYFPGCALIRLLRPGKRFILHIRSGCTFPAWLKRTLRDLLIRLESVFFGRAIVLYSDGLAKHLGLVGRSHIIPLGADPILTQPKTFSSMRLLYIGNLMPMRRIEDTLLGMARFCCEHAEGRVIHYTIVGDGPAGQLQRLKDLASNLGLADCVTFTGWVMHDHLGPFLEQCNVGVSYVPLHPCYDHQPPTKTFEYLFAGMPVVATATSENRRVINDTNGVLIKDTPEGFCRGLCDIVSRLSAFNSEAIRVSVEDYSWQRIVCLKVLPYIRSVVGA